MNKFFTNEFSEEIWEQNYKGPEDKTVEDTWKRIANAIAKPEKNSKEFEQSFYNELENFKLVAGGRIMANAGVEGREGTTWSNCFISDPIDLNNIDGVDSIEGIYELLKKQAHTLKSEGGYGMNFSWLRPKGTYIKGIGVRTPGVLKFMELWDKSSEIITMGSDEDTGNVDKDEKKKIRKGAQMAILGVSHPEIEDFIKAKQTPNRLTKFNMSVAISDKFMEKVKKNQNWTLIFPDTTFEKYNTEWTGDIDDWVEKGHPVKKYKTVKARELWDLIMYSTYSRNEPGLFFVDVAHMYNPISWKEKALTTNPCGEIPMGSGSDSCLLTSINLTRYVTIIDNIPVFDWEAFKHSVEFGIRFLDNAKELCPMPLPEYKSVVPKKRRIGLGVMGLGSALYMLKLKYGSDESLEFIKMLFKTKAETEIVTSAKLGKEKGSFELFDKKKFFNTHWWKTLEISDEIKKEVEKIGYMRNSHRSMCAPTGNTAISAGCVSGGLEPVFMKNYIRWSIVPEPERIKLKRNGFIYPDVYSGKWHENEIFKFAMRGDEEILTGSFQGTNYEIDKNRGLVKATEIEDYGWKFAKEHYSDELDNDVFVTTEDLSVQDHIRVMKIIAHYTDLSISKTVNVPNDYPYEDFKDLYMNAWESGIKGITTYRAGTMTAVLEKKESDKKYKSELEKLFDNSNGKIITDNFNLPSEYNSKGYILRDRNKKKWYVNIAFADSNFRKPFAIFINTNNHESTEVADDCIAKMEQLCLKRGIRKELVERHREKYRGQTNVTKIARCLGLALRHNIPLVDVVDILDEFSIEISSFIFHIKKLLSSFIKDGTIVQKENCPECKTDKMVYQDGCKQCLNCGWSKC